MSLDKFFGSLKTKAVQRIGMVTSIAGNVVNAFEQEYSQDHNAKNAAIDTLIYLLNQARTETPSAQQPPEQPPAIPPAKS